MGQNRREAQPLVIPDAANRSMAFSNVDISSSMK